MTHRERVLAALAHREPDRVPIDFWSSTCTAIHEDGYYRLRGHLGMGRKPKVPLSRPPFGFAFCCDRGPLDKGNFEVVIERPDWIHLGKAVGIPPSTGNVAPVVGVWSLAKKTTTFPTCSASTRAFKRFLCR